LPAKEKQHMSVSSNTPDPSQYSVNGLTIAQQLSAFADHFSWDTIPVPVRVMTLRIVSCRACGVSMKRGIAVSSAFRTACRCVMRSS
jgi:hypothetical protein